MRVWDECINIFADQLYGARKEPEPMKPDEIVRALRCCGTVNPLSCADCTLRYFGDECNALCDIAADCIESLQAQLADMTAQRNALKMANDGLCISHDTVSKQLAESQRRERAANICNGCNHRDTVGCHCGRAKRRGPDAGKGEWK